MRIRNTPIDSGTRLVEGLLAPVLVDREWTALRVTLIAWGDSAFNITRAADRPSRAAIAR